LVSFKLKKKKKTWAEYMAQAVESLPNMYRVLLQKEEERKRTRK
jgi:hypothetical protein